MKSIAPFFTFLSLWIPLGLHAQYDVDSLKAVLSQSKADTSRVNVLNHLAIELVYTQPDSARIYARNSLRLATGLSYPNGESRAYYAIAMSYHVIGKTDSALHYYLRSFHLQQSLKDTLAISSLLNNMASAYTIETNYPKALEYYQQSLLMKRKLGNQASIAKTLNNIGIIFYYQKNYEQAMRYYKQALEIEEQLGNGSGIARTLGNIGLSNLKMDQLAEAERFYLRAYHLADSLQLECFIHYSANGLGDTYFKMGEYDKSERFLQQSHQEAVTCQDVVIESTALINLGNIRMRHRQYDEAEQLILRSYRIAEENELKTTIQEAAESLYQLYKQWGKLDLALRYYEKYVDINKELFNEDLTRELTTQELAFQFQQEKDSLHYARQRELFLFDETIKREKRTKWLTGIGLMITLVVLMLIYLFYIQKKKANRQLSINNEALKVTLEEREVLLQEVHHRVKNNLQVVSSLLNIQSRFLQDQDAKRAVLEGRDRVQSIAMVHERLYQHTNLSRIDLKEYLEQLTSTLLHSYQLHEGEVKISTDVGNIELDLETSIHIGLIVNELISNALKHAFTDVTVGEIQLSFKQEGSQFSLKVSDNGRGVKNEQALTASYGYRIIQSLVRGLSAQLDLVVNQGTSVIITFSK